MLAAYRHLYFSLARRCLAILRYHAQRQRRLRAAVARFTQSTLSKAWEAWRACVVQRRAKARKLHAAAALWAGNATADAFYRWRALATGERRRRAANGAAAALRRLQLQRWALQALWLNRLRRQQERLAAFQASGHMQGFRCVPANEAGVDGWVADWRIHDPCINDPPHWALPLQGGPVFLGVASCCCAAGRPAPRRARAGRAHQHRPPAAPHLPLAVVGRAAALPATGAARHPAGPAWKGLPLCALVLPFPSSLKLT